ncbi:MAG: hypothetical protein HY331_07090 [Chloroflexi bacterium]|nr:hypothetical protein [Chloroflexota bacterium]
MTYDITVLHANWSMGSRVYGVWKPPCEPANVRLTAFKNVGNLSGLAFYQKRA